MSATIEDIPVNGAPPPVEEGWRVSEKTGREYIPRPHGRGVINRQGGETIAEALERDAQPRDSRPRRSRAPKKPPPPKQTDLRELEAMIAEALKSPAVPCAAFGDEWAAEHFTTQGPYLAGNLVRASQYNPWLRRKLESAASGGDMMMQLVAIVGVAGAVGLYIVPPFVYWLNLPLPDKGREMFGIPPDPRRAHAPAPPAPAAPAPAPAAASPAA
jgi:hypothetical protein